MQELLTIMERVNLEALIGKGLKVGFILLIAWVLTKVLQRILRRLQTVLVQGSLADGESVTESSKRIETIVRLLRQAVLLALWVVVTLMVLRELGIEIGPILAGAGILGLAVGFGAQSLVKDVISGFFFILENQVRIGDVVSINGMSGLVEQINFRTIVLRDVAGVVHIIPNGGINSISNQTHGWSAYVFDIGVSYKENVDRVIEVLSGIGAQMRSEEPFRELILQDLEIFGVDKFDESSVVIKGRIKTKPIRQWEVGREFLKRVKIAFDAHHIEIPFPHRTVAITTSPPSEQGPQG